MTFRSIQQRLPPRIAAPEDGRTPSGSASRWKGGNICRAFTVVELMVAISVMTLIVLVLYGLFDQVQKALRGNVAQVDVLEGGRATMQLFSGEMEQMGVGAVPGSTNLFIGLTAMPYQQALLTPGTNRVNVLQQIFFLSHFNKSWVGTGYRVLSLNSNGIATALAEGGVGTLCRYSVTVNDADFPNLPASRTNIFWQVMNWPPAPSPGNLTNYQQVMEGVIHFRVRAFDNHGLLITNSFNTNIPPGVWVPPPNVFFNKDVEYAYAFTNQALPASLEVEMGVLEPHVLERYNSYSVPTAASNYLARQVGAVHLFQERIPIRTAQ